MIEAILSKNKLCEGFKIYYKFMYAKWQGPNIKYIDQRNE
jgi:hypothetical protein